MIGRENFTTPEWQDMQTAILESSRYIILAHPAFFEDLKDSLATKQLIKEFAKTSNSEFIKEVVDFSDYKSPIPKFALNSSEALEPPVLRSITDSVAVINKQDPTSAILFKNLISEIANNVISSNSKISPLESTAYQKVISALDAKPEPETKEWNPNNPFSN